MLRLWLAPMLLVSTIAHADPDPFQQAHPPSPPSIVAPSPAYPPAPVDDGERARHTAKLFLIGGTVAWLASFSISVYAVREYDRALAGNERPATAANVDRANSAVRLSRYGGTSLFVGGAAALGVAGYLYFVRGKRTHTEVVPRTLAAPTLGPDQVGFAVSGGF